jgi:cytidylate kinase
VHSIQANFFIASSGTRIEKINDRASLAKFRILLGIALREAKDEKRYYDEFCRHSTYIEH